MKSLLTFTTVSIALFLSACDDKSSSPALDVPEATVGYRSPEPMWKEDEYTKWMSRAELQYLQDMSPSQQYFAYVEGRNNHGVAEYRAVKGDLATEEYNQWAVFWGIDEKELFDWELRLLRTGFERKSMQVFFDSKGNPIHQIVWLRPVGAVDNVPEEEMETIVQAPEPKLPIPTEPSEEPTPTMLVVPEEEATPVAPIVVEPQEETPKAQIVYVIVPGDTLSKIARRYKTTVEELKKKNGLKNDILRIGQKLKLP